MKLIKENKLTELKTTLEDKVYDDLENKELIPYASTIYNGYRIEAMNDKDIAKAKMVAKKYNLETKERKFKDYTEVTVIIPTEEELRKKELEKKQKELEQKKQEENKAKEIKEGMRLRRSKKLNETWQGDDIINDLVDRAQGYIDDGYDVTESINNAIDDGLIYTSDIIDLADHYGVIDDGELIEKFYDDLYTDIADRVEEKDEVNESIVRNIKVEPGYHEWIISVNNIPYYSFGDISDTLDGYTNAEDFANDELDNFKELSDQYFDEGEKVDNFTNNAQKIGKLTSNENANVYYGIINMYNYYKGLDESIKNKKKKTVMECLKEARRNRAKRLGSKKKNLQERLISVKMDSDDIVEQLMDRVDYWTKDPFVHGLYEQMYQNYVDNDIFDDIEFDVNKIVDNDWINDCEVISKGDEGYDKILELYNKNGLGDISVETDYSYIEAAKEDENGDLAFLLRW